MELIKDLGIKEYCKTRRRMGQFKCPVCEQLLDLRLDKGKKQKTCKGCRGTQNVTHGMSGKPVYYVWQMMRDRCSNPNNEKFNIYGGKGIKVCKDWMTFEGFWKDMEEGYGPGMTIDRICSNKGYCKENCQWLIRSENSAKTSKVRPVTQYHVVRKPDNKLLLLREWPSAKAAADELGLTAAHISVVCQGKRKTHGGYAWQFAD
jgi:hypothetical protein